MRKVKLLLIGMVTTLLAGCGQQQAAKQEIQENNKEVVSLTVSGSADDQELLGTMAETFKETYKEQAEFEISVIPLNEADCKNTLVDSVTEAPDVFAFVDDQLMEVAAAGIVEPIANEEQIKADNSEGSIEAATLNGKIYAYPMTADNGYFMFYNKKYFKEQDVQTLDKMLEIAQANNKKVTMDWNSGWYLYSFFGNTGLTLGLNEDGITNHCDWNSTSGEVKGVDVGQAMLAIATKNGFINGGDDSLIAGAKNGSVIAGISGVWSSNALEEAWGENYAAVKLPTYTCAGKQVQMSSYAGYKMLGVNSYSKNKEWAEKLAEWITNEENQTLRFLHRGQGPSNNKAAKSEEVLKSPAIQALIEQSEYASLQRVGGSYWEPMAAFGETIAQKKATTSGMQKLLDTTVKNITAKVTD